MRCVYFSAVGLAALTIMLIPRSQPKQGSTYIVAASQQENPPSSIAPPVPGKETAANNQTTSNQSPDGNASPEWILVFVTAITGAFIAWQAWETRKAAKSAAGSVQLMDDVAKRELRAYVCVSSGLLKFRDAGGNKVFEAEIHLKNSGKTPAYDVQTFVRVVTYGYPLNMAQLPIPDLQPGLPLGPDTETVMMREVQTEEAFIPLLGTPQGTVYVYGEFRYKDAFGDERHTKYRLIWGARRLAPKDTNPLLECTRFRPDSCRKVEGVLS